MAVEKTTRGESGNDREARSVQVAIYTRKSNDENLTGNVTSIDNQKNACRSYIGIYKDKGWQEYPEVFDDPAESGKDLKRPAVQRLLKAVQEGRVQAVIVYKLDRLTRNSRDFHSLMELFEKHNVAFVSATESLDTKSPQGRLMVNIMVQFAQYDRELDQERSKDFHIARAKKGLWCGGLPPLGYDLKEKLLVVNDKEARLVRRIFDLYLERKSTYQVADELNRLGYRRKVYSTQKGESFGGQPFDPDSVSRVLQRKVYIGTITNERTGLEFPGLHKPIVTTAIFEAAQKLLEIHNKNDGEQAEGTNRHGFLLKGLIRCGDCEGAMVGLAQPRKAKVYLYYKCLSKINGIKKECPVGAVSARKVEEYLIEKLAAVGYDRPLLERVVAKVKEITSAQLGPLEEEKRDVTDRASALEAKIAKIMDLAQGPDGSAAAKKELRRLESAKGALDLRRGELEAMIGRRKAAVYDVDVIQGALQRFARFVYQMPIDARVRTVQLLVQRVILAKDRLTAELHELPVADLQRVLDVKMAEDPISFKSRRSPNRRDLNVKGGGGTGVVESEQNWRGRRDLNPRSPP